MYGRKPHRRSTNWMVFFPTIALGLLLLMGPAVASATGSSPNTDTQLHRASQLRTAGQYDEALQLLRTILAQQDHIRITLHLLDQSLIDCFTVGNLSFCHGMSSCSGDAQTLSHCFIQA